MTPPGGIASAAPRRGLIALSVMLATIMQALDTTIANVALPHMQGSLSATQDEISWVLTSYIVAAAIMTPPTGYLSARFGRKNLFLTAVDGFTIASMLCGVAETLPQMVLFRLLQGMFGAALVPLSQVVLLDSTPQEKQGSAMALWGVGVMVGPILGPTLGGYLTDHYNWRWVFYINVPFGLMAFFGILAYVPDTVRDFGRRFDWLGFAMLSLAIGALQIMLDRGELKDWFGSPEIVVETAVGALALYLFIAHSATSEHPFLEPKMFKDRNFTTGLFFIFIVGIILLATLALLPPLMQDLMGYPVLTTGLVLAPRGIGTMAAMFVVGRLIGRIDSRLLVGSGMVIIAYSLWEMMRFTADVPPSLIVWTGAIQGIGLGFVFIPLSTVTFATLPVHFRTDAASLFSLIRNIGSSIGISVVTSLLTRSIQINHAELSAHVTAINPYLPMHLLGGTSVGRQLATAGLDAEITRQAAMIGYLNDFKLMMIVAIAALPMLFLLKRPQPTAAPVPQTAAVPD